MFALMIITIIAQGLSITWLLNSSQVNSKACFQGPELQNKSNINRDIGKPEGSDALTSDSISPTNKNKGSEIHQLTTIEIFRRFALLAPSPLNTPYILADPHATYYSDSNLQQDRKIDELLKQRERGFFIEV